METTKFLEFLSAHKRLVFTTSLVALAIGLAQSCRSASGRDAKKEILAAFAPGLSNLHVAVNRPVRMPSSVWPAGNPQPVASRPKPNVMLSLHVDAPDGEQAPLGPYSPYGRMLQCVLVNSLDSGLPDTPVIGLVVKDLWHAGELIVPAGSELHGLAQIDRIRDRIIARGQWILVWQSGEELSFSGVALNREPGDSGDGWQVTDGSPGLEGDVIRSQSLDEIKLFLATALAGVATGLQQQRTTTLGIGFIPGTARNAAVAGTTQVLNTYAQQVLETIKKDGVFIRVPAGKPFYVYATETLDPSKASLAGASIERFRETAKNERHLNVAGPGQTERLLSPAEPPMQTSPR